MNNLGNLIAITLFLMIGLSVYIHLVRPVILFAIRRKLVGLRDELRVHALMGDIPKDDQGFRVLDMRLMQLCDIDCNISFSMTLMFKKDVADQVQDRKDFEILENSNPLVRKILEETKFATFSAVMANSPMWWAVIPILVISAPISAKAKRISRRLFWNGTDGHGMHGMGGACPA